MICCSVLQCVAVLWTTGMLQCVAVCCGVLQCFAMFCTLDILLDQSKGSCCSVLQCAAECCLDTRYVAKSVERLVAVVAVCCRLLQSADWTLGMLLDQSKGSLRFVFGRIDLVRNIPLLFQ